METRYFGWYFKYFVYGYWAALGLALALLLLPARFYTLKRYVEHIVLFVGIMLGVGFWAVSGPDPRFGMVYLIPLFALLTLHNLTLIAALKSLYLRLVGLVAFFATLTPWFLLRKVALVWIWGVWVVLKVFVDSNARYGRIKLLVGALLAIASFWASYALYGKHALNAMKDTKKCAQSLSKSAPPTLAQKSMCARISLRRALARWNTSHCPPRHIGIQK
ncbi:hypothetical protein [uncultured Helicobacter sp.]|uniref:hypothetical protein n=1 Tax=uncultured Helicobacter sp. TaxID=175537 RepID=UPI00374F0875